MVIEFKLFRSLNHEIMSFDLVVNMETLNLEIDCFALWCSKHFLKALWMLLHIGRHNTRGTSTKKLREQFTQQA